MVDNENINYDSLSETENNLYKHNISSSFISSEKNVLNVNPIQKYLISSPLSSIPFDKTDLNNDDTDKFISPLDKIDSNDNQKVQLLQEETISNDKNIYTDNKNVFVEEELILDFGKCDKNLNDYSLNGLNAEENFNNAINLQEREIVVHLFHSSFSWEKNNEVKSEIVFKKRKKEDNMNDLVDFLKPTSQRIVLNNISFSLFASTSTLIFGPIGIFMDFILFFYSIFIY
jgi:hypothetical protein